MKFGLDPEFVVLTRLGRPIPAHQVGFPYKTERLTLVREQDSGRWASRAFRDGYAIEVNIRPDTHCQTVVVRMAHAMRALRTKLWPWYTISTVPAVQINLQRDMKDAPVDVKQFGCEPSYCAYELTAKRPPIDAITHPYRYFGGHIHFGHPGGRASKTYDWLLDRSNHPMFGKILDLRVGLPMTYLFDSAAQYLRRRYYGQAGEYRSQQYRPTKYSVGFEYRTPGPEMWRAPWLSSLFLGLGQWCAANFPAEARQWDKSIEDDLRLAINTGVGVQKLLARSLAPEPVRRGLSPATWTVLKPHVPAELKLRQFTELAIAGGFRDWAVEHITHGV